MTKVEQVARAIAAEIDEARYYKSPVFQKAARAAIQAMREPNARMKDAACAVGPDTNSGCFGYDNAEDVYEAMIDAALSETSEDKA